MRLVPAGGVELLSDQGLMKLEHLDATVGSQVVEWFVRSDGGDGAELGTLVVDGGVMVNTL